ncbi:MAG: hypothetical protein J1E78_06880 [Muribaculaceae bacterium]|nr:hypothetical protein [Muribaculaceae bacterium]
MADNDKLNPNQNQDNDPFAHPIKRNNWWLYIFGGIVIAGIIIWFFVNWSYKNRDRAPEIVDQQEQIAPAQQEVENLPDVTVEGVEGGDQEAK